MIETKKEKPIGKIFCTIGQNTIVYAGEIEEDGDFLRIFDEKTKQLISVQKAKVQQIVWLEGASV